MSGFPAMPGWDGIHPAMVHFPVALLLVAPLLIVASLFARRAWRSWVLAALVVMALGTLAAWLAVGSGHAAGQLADKAGAVQRAIERHEALGLATRNLFTLLTVGLAAMLAAQSLAKRPVPEAVRIVSFALFVVVYAACTGVLATTANEGGRLVHEHGVHAVIGRPAPPAIPAAAVEAPAGPAVATARR